MENKFSQQEGMGIRLEILRAVLTLTGAPSQDLHSPRHPSEAGNFVAKSL